MATQITFTDDVGRVSTDQNLDGSIRWYVYERTVAGVTGLYVRRDVGGTLEPEVFFIQEGRRPTIRFEPDTDQWTLFYILSDNVWMVTIDENDAPVLQTAQPITDTVVDRLGGHFSDQGDVQTAGQRAAERVIGLGTYDALAPPKPPLAVGTQAHPTLPLTQFRIVFFPKQDIPFQSNQNIVGFRIYVRRSADGGVVPATLITPVDPIPFVDYKQYTVDVSAVPGTYFVTQVSFQGPQSTTLVESRKQLATDSNVVSATSNSAPNELPAVNTSVFASQFGEGLDSEEVRARFVFIDQAPVLLLPPADDFDSHFGEGFKIGEDEAEFPFKYTTIFVTQGLADDNLDSHFGEGRRGWVILQPGAASLQTLDFTEQQIITDC